MQATSLHHVLRLAPVTLWVEDDVTRSVLTDLWRDPEINVMAAAGKKGVGYLVEAAQSEFKDQVFGLVDRDFDPDNRDSWETTSKFRLPAFEIENLLLDFSILATLSEQPAEAIERTANELAHKLVWPMVCRHVIHDLYRVTRRTKAETGRFPREPGVLSSGEPKQRLDSAADVARYIVQTDYIVTTSRELQQWSQVSIEERAERYAGSLQKHLAGEQWKQSFPGKRILRWLRNRYKRLEPERGNTHERDRELARRIAREMRRTNAVPPVFEDIRAIIRRRAGLA